MILLVGALIAETTPLLALLSNRKLHGKRLITGFYQKQKVGILTCGVGPEKAFARTTEALQALNVQHVV